MLGILTKPLAWLLTFLYGIIGNYGITLIVVTVIVKFAMYPVYKKQILSTMGMADMQPKMQAIQRQYANDKEKMNEKMAELYEKEGFSPMAGCLPMFIQMIILMGFFTLLRNPMAYIPDEQMYFAIHESFLWIKDLSQPDPWVLPILSGVATFLSFWMNEQQMSGPGGQTSMMTKVMAYAMPIMFVWLARTYPSGIAVYWSIGQVVQIFFNLRFNHIRKVMREKNKPAKHKK